MTMLKSTAPWLTSIGLVLGLVQGGVLIVPAPAFAGPDLSTDVVAPYVHLVAAIPPATGPLTTVFLIRSPKAGPVIVTLKCFNEFSQPVGPSSPNLSLAMFQTFHLAPVSTFGPTDLSSSPNYTGRGWCYFSSADKFSVEVAWGLWPNTALLSSGKIVAGNELELFRSGSSVGVGIAVGQSMVAGAPAVGVAVIPGVGNVPLWLGGFGGTRFDVLVLVNPTAVSGQVTVNVFDCSGCNPMQAPTPVQVSLPARGMAFVFLSTFETVSFPEGNASINSGATCCFLGWRWAINLTTHQAIFREVTLDRDTSRFLGASDRP